MLPPALSVRARNEKMGIMIPGPTLSGVERVAAEQPGKFIYRHKAQMRLTAKPIPAQMTQNFRDKASPRGSWPRSGLKGQGMESRQPKASFFFTCPLSALRSSPEGEPAFYR